MLWSFRAVFSVDRSKRTSTLPSNAQEEKHQEKRGCNVFVSPIIRVTSPECEDGSLASEPRICHCGYEQVDFCPYCDYEQGTRGSVELLPGSISSHNISSPNVQLDPTLHSRRLRKSRHSHQHLQFEPLNTESIMSARPDSFLSSNSGTPLLNNRIHSNHKYPLLPDLRTPNKLEKRRRSISMADPNYSSFCSPSEMGSKNIRAVTARALSKTKSFHSFGPRPKPASRSIDTNALVSLAWTGEMLSPMRSSESVFSGHETSSSSQVYFGSPPSSTDKSSRQSSYMSSESVATPRPRKGSSAIACSSQNRRSVLRKSRDVSDILPQMPWTLAMAITDDGISDERLVDDLEDMRIKDEPPEPPLDLYPLGLGPPPVVQILLDESYAEYPLRPGEFGQEDLVSPSDSDWNAARQALLVCRELVRTERRYLASLKSLIKNGTATPPPPILLPYLPGLIAASDGLLRRMEDNPSVQGVSEAFLGVQDKLDESFVNWCSIVGELFHQDDNPKTKSESGDGPESSSSKLKFPRPRGSSTRTLYAESCLPTVTIEPNKIRRNSKARPTVRDLAILPTQRIVRYVLLFKALHSLTPSVLPSFAIVEEALQASQSIAQRADGAQEHSAFTHCLSP